MEYSETIYPKKAANFINKKVVDKVIDILSTYCIDCFFNTQDIQAKIDADQYGNWNKQSVSLFLDFRKYDHINIEFECPDFSVVYLYERNSDFETGRHYLRVNSIHNDSVYNAFLNFIEMMQLNAFSKWNQKLVRDENGKLFALIDLVYREQSSSGDIAELYVSDSGINWGVSGPPQMTMSAVGGAGGTVTFQEFMEGKCQDFIRNHFGEKVLEEVKKNVALRMK